MKLFFYLILLLLTAYNVYLSSFSVRSGEVNFFSDVARDFLLLDELDEKKIVLIGPRSNTSGLFHGPLWSYINYPAYLLGNGNPVTVAWFWIFLGGIFLLTSFFMVRKLLGTLPAFAYILLTSIRMPTHINNVFHSEAMFFFVPLFFFTIGMYIKSKKNLYLALHILALAILIQLNVGIGLQFLMLSTPLVLWFIFKHKLRQHLLTFSLLPLFLSNFILFDLRHGLRMAKALLSTAGSLQFFIPLQSWLENRINNTISLQLFEQNSGNTLLNYIIFCLVVIFSIKHRQIYLLFLFYYFGYILLSFFNKGVLLYHYVHLLIPLTTLWFVSFLGTKYKLLFLPLIGLVFFFNFNNVEGYIAYQRSIMGNHPNSWKGLSKVAAEVIAKQQGKEFGYFVFAPDAYAYQSRYAMIYNFKTAHAKAFEYTKKATTYIIAAPSPPNDPYMTYVWWRKNEVNISSEPVEMKKFPNGFTIEKFNLTPEEQNVLHDKNIELGIHFR